MASRFIDMLPGMERLKRIAEPYDLSDTALHFIWEVEHGARVELEAFWGRDDSALAQLCALEAARAQGSTRLLVDSTLTVASHEECNDGRRPRGLWHRGPGWVARSQDIWLEQELVRHLTRLRRTQDAGARLDGVAHAGLAADNAGLTPDAVAWTDEQRAAVHGILNARVSVLRGGPGTGKTTVLRAVLQNWLQQGDPRAALTLAPTGKAADRMRAVMAPLLEQYAQLAPPQTLHRALGYSPTSREFRFGTRARWSASLIVVDEASMLDTELANAFFSACQTGAQVLLIGDEAQLPSVRPGNVLADLISADAVATFSLSRNLRVHDAFSTEAAHESSVGGAPVWRGVALRELAECVRSGSGVPVTFETEVTRIDARARVLRLWVDVIHRSLGRSSDPQRWLDVFDRYRILCPLRGDSPDQPLTGAHAISRALSEYARALGLAGKPVMVHTNDYTLSLWNGDSGVLVDGKVYFRGEGQVPRVFEATALQHLVEDAWAITVHKAQGSEYEHVLLVCPAGASVSRALLYTGVTRARVALAVLGARHDFQAAVHCEPRRHTGLPELLRPPSV